MLFPTQNKLCEYQKHKACYQVLLKQLQAQRNYNDTSLNKKFISFTANYGVDNVY